MKKGGSQEKSVILSIFPFVAEKSFGSSGSAGTIGTSYAKELLFAERKAAATALFLRVTAAAGRRGALPTLRNPPPLDGHRRQRQHLPPPLPAAGKIRPIPLK